MKPHGYLGALVILVAELLLFSGNQFVGVWFTPIVWTGYILLLDALVFRISRRSLLLPDRLELLVIVVVSIGLWWLCEFYNAPRFWASDLELWWHYHNLTPNPYLRRFGYDWAFATILPALFLTAQLLMLTLLKKLRRFGQFHFSRMTLYLFVLAGAIGVIVPLVFVSVWLAPVLWLAFIFLVDPINYLRGWPSITGDLASGKLSPAVCAAFGGACVWRALGVLELLGHFEMDIYGSLFWRRKNIRDAGAWLSWLPAICS